MLYFVYITLDSIEVYKMQIYLRICPDCAKENIRESYHSKIYVPGTMDWAKDDESADSRICEIHNRGYLKLSITCDEFQVLDRKSVV